MTDRQANEIETQSASNQPHDALMLNERSWSGPSSSVARSIAAIDEISDPAATPWQTMDLARLWHGLCAGAWKFQDVFNSDLRCYAVIERVEHEPAKAIRGRCIKVLTRLLLGETHKVVAFDLGVALSTVVSAAQEALRTMGLKCQGSRAPLLLAMAARAALHPRSTAVLARFQRVCSREGGSLLLSMARPDLHFPAQLSTAESAVLRQLMSGRTHAQIARSRATSRRTVANQLAAAFRKLGVSGRGALTAHLIAMSPEFLDSRAIGSQRATQSDPWLAPGAVPTRNGSSHEGSFRGLAAGGLGGATSGASLMPASST